MRKAIAVIAGGLALILAGCTAPTVPQDHYYRLSVSAPKVALARPPLPGILSVERFSADGLTAGRSVVFTNRSRPNELSEYNYHFWTEPPTDLVPDLVVGYLRAARIADRVVTPDMRIEPTYVMRGRILRMEQILGSQPGVSLELEIAIHRPDQEKILLMERYRVDRPTADESVPAAIDALGGAMNEILGRLAADIQKG